MAIGGIAAAFSFNSVMDSFHQHCILGSEILFSHRNESTQFGPRSNETYETSTTTTTTSTTTTTAPPSEVEEEKSIIIDENKKNLFKFLHPDNGIAEPIEMIQKKLVKDGLDKIFFESSKINQLPILYIQN